MRRKFQIVFQTAFGRTNFKFQIFLLAAAVALFVMPAKASAAPSATISGPNWSWWNQNLTYTAQVYGGSSGSIFITRQDNASFTCPSGIVTDSQGRRWCVLKTFTYSSTGTGYFTPREIGTYVAVANGYANSTASFTASSSTECTGNPFSYNTGQWSDCGGSDNIFFTVYAPAPTPTSTVNNSCTSTDTNNLLTISWPSTSPAISYVDISSNNFSGWNYKYVAGSTSTTASTGFGGAYNVSGPLQFIPGTWYAARLWNGSAHSNWAWFQTPVACPPPSGSLGLTSGSQSIKPGNTNGFRASLSNAGSGQIWVTKGDGRSSFTCPNGIYYASTGRYWCPIVRNSGSTLTGSYNFAEPGSYTVVINAFTKSDQTGTGPRDQCSGTPASLGFDSSKWSDCGGSSRITVTVTPDCNASPDCNLCSASWGTCSANNGSTICYYRSYTGGGACNVVSFNQSCTIDKCNPGTTCISGSCIAPPPAPSLAAPSCPAPGTTASFNWSGNNSATTYYELFIDNKANGWGSYSTGNDSANRINSPGNSFSSTTFAGDTYGWWMRACNSVGCSSESYGSNFTCTRPNCNTNPDCDLCSVPTNTCSANNGNQICYYRGYIGGGACNVVSFGQSCTRSNCSSGSTCTNGICVPPPPTAAISSPSNNSSAAISQNTAVSATANGTNLTWMDIYRAPKTADLTRASSWTKIAGGSCSGSSCRLSGSWTPSPSEGGQWVISVNAFDSYDQRCSGMQTTGGYWTAWCGRNGSTSNVTVNITPPPPTNPIGSCPIPGTQANVNWTGNNSASRYDVFAFDLSYGSPNWSKCGSNGLVVCQQVPNGTSYSFSTTPGKEYQWYVISCKDSVCSAPARYSTTFTCIPHPTATLNITSGSQNITVGNNVSFKADLSNAGSGQIWVTKDNGQSNFSCPSRSDGLAQQVSTGLYWCPLALQNNTATLSGTYQFKEKGTYTAVVNAFENPSQTVTSDPNKQCSGTPASLGFNATKWSDCGGSDNISVTVINPPPPTATLSAPGSITTGQTLTVSATSNGTDLTWMDIYRAPLDSNSWTKIAGGSCSGSSCRLSGSWVPTVSEAGQWKIAVNAFDSYDQRCSGMQTTGGYWTAWCGRNGTASNVTVNVILPPPQATISGPKTAIANDFPPLYTATLSKEAKSGEIWVTKGDGLLRFPCTTQMIQASKTKRFWCLMGKGTKSIEDSTLTGKYQFEAEGDYTVTVNAYNNKVPEGTSPADRCTGTPDNLSTDSAGNDVTWNSWSKCDPDDPKNNNSRAYIPIAVSEPLTTTNCGGGINPRAEGLVTTPSLTGKFGTSPEGRCIKDDPKTRFKAFKIPTYDELKSVYFTQSKAKKSTNPGNNITSITTLDDGTVFNYIYTSDVTIGDTNPYIYTGTAVIFIDGSLTINNDIKTGNNPTKGLVLVVKNNVNIKETVKQIDAIIISSGIVCTAYDGASCRDGQTPIPSQSQLVVNGSLISIYKDEDQSRTCSFNPSASGCPIIQFRRNLTNNACASCAAERINAQAKYLVILNNLFAETIQRWSEVQ